MKKERPLNGKEREFCRACAQGANEREAAVRAGFLPFPIRTAGKLMARTEIREEILRCRRQGKELAEQEAQAGLRRLAFGGVGDCIRLAFDGGELAPEALEGLDLFNLSEIKIPKAGGVELKFFDRIKALEALAQHQQAQEEGNVASLYQALDQGARQWREGGDG